MIYQYILRKAQDLNTISWGLNYWIFRGQTNSKWPLATKLERVAKQFDNRSPNDLEWTALDQFMRQAHQYSSQLPAKEQRVDWLALMQHYGGPTRLLDFTKSFYVALFFAIESGYAETEAAVYAFNESKLFEGLGKKLKDDTSLDGTLNYLRAHQRINKRKRHENCDLGLLPIMPHMMNDRQSLQQGVFLFPEELSHTTNFEDNLCAEFGIKKEDLSSLQPIEDTDFFKGLGNSTDDKLIIKIIIPADSAMRSEIMAELYKMNISARTLFPGLDGLGRSLNFSKRWYDAIQRISANDFTQ